MKKVVGFIIVSVILLVSLSFKNTKNKDSYFENDASNNKNMLSMMLEQNSGAGDYLQVTQSNWPTEGYIFNKERSGCENGGELSWDDTRKTVVMMGNTSDKCYVYFDIWDPSFADVCNNGDYLSSCVKAFGNLGADISNIYIHNSSLANGAGDNSYRYAGASDKVNNFVCFGSTETPCPNDNLYRMIGVVDGKVKLIKYDFANSNLLGTDGDYYGSFSPESSYKGKLTSIDDYYWNYKATNAATNTWSTSLLNKTNLNTNFLNNLGDAWASKIATTTWKVGGNLSDNIFNVISSVAYQNEIINPDAANSTDNATTYNAKVGLIYASDYGFAASPSTWTTILHKYIGSKNDVNWMYIGRWYWLITRHSKNSQTAFGINNLGYVDGGYVGVNCSIRPSFNLESFVTYKSGKGTENDPIVIN